MRSFRMSWQTVLFLVVGLAVYSTAQVPSYIKVCGRRNPNLDQCVLNSVKDLIEILKVGIPEMDVPPLDPLYIDQVKLVDTPNFHASAENVSLKKFSIFEVRHLHVNLENRTIDVEVFFPNLYMEASYDVSARILVPVAGKGPITSDTSDVLAKVTLYYKLVDRGGKKYLYFYSMNTKLTLGDYTANFSPPGGPNTTLAIAINQALRESRQELIASTTPNLEKAISERILTLANRICKHFTYEEFFPDRE